MRAVWALLIILALASCASNTNLAGSALEGPWPNPPEPPEPPTIDSNEPPTITVTRSVNSNQVPSQVTISASVSDPDGDSLTVTYFKDGQQVGQPDSSSPYTYTYTEQVPGTYTYRASVSDGSVSVSDSANSITLTGNAPPQLSLSRSFSDSEVPSDITLRSGATDPDGDSLTVTFFKNGQQLGQPVTSSPYNYQYTETEPGTYEYSVVVTDGPLETSGTFNSITLDAPNNPPQISEIITAVSSPTAPSNIDLEAIVSDLDPDANLQVNFYLGDSTSPFKTENQEPYEAQYTATQAGEYIFRANVSDEKDSAELTKTITIAQAQEAPVVTVTAQTQQSVPPAVADVVVTATDANGDNLDVQLNLTFTAPGSAPQQIYSNTVSSSHTTSDDLDNVGSYVWSVSAYDGTFTSTDEASITLTPVPNQPPSGTLTASRTSGTIPSQIIASVNDASDDDLPGLSVEFFLNGASRFEDTDAPFEHTYDIDTAGDYIVTATLRDSGGQTVDTEPKSFTIDTPLNEDPFLNMTVSANSSNPPANVTVDYSIYDPEFDLTTFYLYIDGDQEIQRSNKVGQYSLVLDQARTYLFFGEAIDAGGRSFNVSQNLTLTPASTDQNQSDNTTQDPSDDTDSSNNDDDDNGGGGSGGRSGGSGGGYIPRNICTPQVSCSQWSSCADGERTRTCSDANSCEEDKVETQSCVKKLTTSLESEGLDKELTLYESGGVFQGDLSGIVDGQYFTLTLSEDQSEQLLVEDLGSRERFTLNRIAPNVYTNEPIQEAAAPEPESILDTPLANADEQTQRDYTVFFILVGILIVGAAGAIEAKHLLTVRKQDQKLIDYIEQYKYAGRDRLRELLLSSGWNEKRVDKLLDKEFKADSSAPSIPAKFKQ